MNWSRSFALIIFAITLMMALSAVAAESPHQHVLVQLNSDADFEFINNSVDRLDILSVKPGHYAEIATQGDDLKYIQDAGLQVKILTENMEANYASRSKGIGYGIYHTYSENIAFVDSLHLLYPEVISEKWSIGQSHEGRDLWCFRVSDNPSVDEGEPEILIDGKHHAREIMASEFPIMFAEYLAQNYGTDPEITWLLDNRELYIVPIVNPDGDVYNESGYPNGGGMWRKNRRNNGGGSFGVDPNRNYPYNWGLDNNGSSPDPSSETYRGPSAGSEPEIQALMALINEHDFITHDSVHTYSNLTLFPWGYTSADSPHHSTFVHMGDEMTKFNGYEPGQPSDILYDVNGGANDWVYGATGEHNMIFSFCNEIGSSSDGFWPDESRRGPLFQENIWPHIYLMRAAGTFIAVHTPVVADDAKTIDPGGSGDLNFTIENQSVVASAMDLTLTVSTDDAWAHFESAERSVGDLAAMASTTLFSGIPVTIDEGCPNGHNVIFTVTVHMAEGDIDFPLSFMVGTPSDIFSDNLENGLGNWTLTGAWGATGSTYHSATTSLTDSPTGEYNDQEATRATINGTYQATELTFWHRYDIEDNYDYGRVQVSANGGGWTTLISFDGTQNSWIQQSVDLSAYAGQDLSIRFMLETDYSVTEDGWYIDDVVLVGAGSDNLAPEAPIALSPVGGVSQGSTPELTVSNVVDPEGETVSYGFRVYSDALETDIVASANGVAQGATETSWQTSALNDGTYYWRAFASDGVERSELGEVASFSVESTSGIGDGHIINPRLSVLGNVTGNGARLQLNLPSSVDVSVDIYDARGARIRQLHSGAMNSGSSVLVWDGRDGSGRSASSGVYFVRAIAGAETMTGRVVVVR